MIKTGIKEARKRLSEYINMVQRGEEIIITRRDVPVAKLVSIGKTRLKNLKTRKGLRSAIRPKGKPLSKIVIESREERI